MNDLSLNRVPDSLSDRLLGGERAIVAFAGQGGAYIDALRACRGAFPGSRRVIGSALAWLDRFAADARVEATGRLRNAQPFERVFDASEVIEWSSAAVSYPLIFMAQAVRWEALRRRGLRAVIDAGGLAAATGHSQGMLTAAFVAELGAREWDDALFERYLCMAGWLGVMVEVGYVEATGAPAVHGDATPMVAVSGLRTGELQALLDAYRERHDDPVPPAIGLRNTWQRHVVSAPPDALGRFVAFAEDALARRADAKKRGRVQGRVPDAQFLYLPVSGAFHLPELEAIVPEAVERMREDGAIVDPSAFAFPVQRCNEGGGLLEGDAMQAFVATQYALPVDWPGTWEAVIERFAPQWALDGGPEEGIFALTRSCLEGTGIGSVALGVPAGEAALFDQTAPRRPLCWDELAPRRDGERVRNRFTEVAGAPPILLPGMTPTTVDAPIVAAAANAGFVAEIAGGGQVTAATWDERVRELHERLEPGAEVVFNALYLDRYLWGLHFEKEGIVAASRRRGAPICGVTVSAGIPEPDEAKALLDAWAAEGIWLNAFKPGTYAQVRQVCAIAKAAPDHDIFVHLEGGKAGGHHSWEDLEDLLLEGYAAIRRHDNLVLCVGGGVRSPERAAELLDGSWALRHGRARMPVDAVFIGTPAMACAEATATPEVKQALAEAAGTEAWVTPGRVDGRVTSGKSQLDADIHYLDNAASRCGRLLDEVAGDTDAIAARHDEIVAALAQTAKPWFGDLRAMSWRDVCERMVALMAIGTGDRYHDGVWLDRTWRERVFDVMRRAERRAVGEGAFEPVIGTAAELDDPVTALARLGAARPELSEVYLTPSDVRWFLDEVCRRPGKPVPFVPVIDADVRRWYKSDSLWQAQHAGYGADQVLVIPGPEAVAGIERADEPVAELLARYEAAMWAAAAERDEVRSTRRSLARGATFRELTDDAWALRFSEDLSPRWRTALRARVPGQAVAVLAAPVWHEGTTARVNPLHAIVRGVPGDELRGDGSRWSYRPDGASTESVSASCEGDHVVVRVSTGDGEPERVFTLRPTARRGRASWCLDPTEERSERGRFHAEAMGGQTEEGADVAPVALFEPATIDATLNAAAGVDYARATGFRGRGVPDGWLFSVAWPALFACLAVDELSDGFERLVHASNEVERTGQPLAWGEALRVQSRVTRVTDASAGREIVCVVRFERSGTLAARMTSRFLIRGDFGGTPWRERRLLQWDEELVLADDAACAFVTELDGLTLRSGAQLVPGEPVRFDVTGRFDRARNGLAHATARGAVLVGGRPVADVAIEQSAVLAAHPLEATLTAVGAREGREHARDPYTLTEQTDRAPRSLAAFARAGRDRNPIHRSLLYARYAGFDQPIVHGMWTLARLDAFLRDDVLSDRADRVLRARTEFLAPLLPGEPIALVARRVGVGTDGIQIELEARVERDGAALPVARTRATVRAPRTAWLFPGQGIQTPGMGMEAMKRSPAARAIWNRADAYTRSAHGFSVLQIVQDNPTSLEVHGQVLRHPQGVLHLTQFTQVAMAVLAHAQVAELREAGLSFDGDITAGHSVGEYNALAALAGVISLEAGIDAVYRRGQAMHRLVPRDENGESGFRMGVARPHYAGIDHAGLEALVAAVAERTGEFVEIVNFNVRGRQYSVTGTVAALDALEAQLLERMRPGGKTPWVLVPGIDVPFHSRALRAGVGAFRASLEVALPAKLDVGPLVGRYVPNLVPRPFAVERAFVSEVHDWCGSPVLEELLADWAEGTPPPAGAGRALLIELLAYQFASPVRWIETQELLFDPEVLGVERVVEVGLGSQPTVANMARYTRSLLGGVAERVDVYNSEADAEAVRFAEADGPEVPASTAPAPAEPAQVDPAPEAVAAPVRVAAASAGSGAAAPDDRAGSVLDALRALLAIQARVALSEVGDTLTIEELFDGVSARRNQALMDIGAEFGVGSIDGAHEMPLVALAAAIEARGARAASAGRYLRATQDAAIQRFGARAGLSRGDLEKLLESRYGLGPGWRNLALTQLALELRAGGLGALGELTPASRGEAEQALDEVVEALGAAHGTTLGPLATDTGAGAAVDAAVVRELEERVLGADGTLAEWARDLLARVDRTEVPAAPQDDSAHVIAERILAEFGEDFVRFVAPAFDRDRHVWFGHAWAHAQRDVARLFFDARSGRVDEAEMGQRGAALAAHRKEPRVAATAAWCRAQAQPGSTLERVLSGVESGGPDAPIAWSSMAPTLHDSANGPSYAEVPRGDEPRDRTVASWFALDAPQALLAEGRADATAAWREAAVRACSEALPFRGETAVVTGASPGSIAFEMVRHLLRGGARVVVTTTTYHQRRLEQYRRLYREAAGPGSELHIVPFNQASAQDVRAFVDWLFARVTVQEGATVRETKPAFRPTLVIPFGAMGDLATTDATDGRSEAALRAMLVGVERLVTGIGARYRRDGLPSRPCHVVLPLSPNIGTFGGDGFYGEAKAALAALMNKATSERDVWGEAISFAGARIGWVRGTGLMDANNPVAAVLERDAGVVTWSASEMAHLLVAACADAVRAEAAQRPLLLALDAGLAATRDLRGAIDAARDAIAAQAATTARLRELRTAHGRLLGQQVGDVAAERGLPAWLDVPEVQSRPWRASAPATTLDDAIVIVSTGEIGPWGTGRTRWAFEVHRELSPAAVLELAWMTGRVAFRPDAGGWFDVERDERIDEAEIVERFRDEILESSGIRVVDPEVAGYDPDHVPVLATVYLDRDMTFGVGSEDEAETFRRADPEHTSVSHDAERGQWMVTRRAGSEIRVPRSTTWNRHVAGLVPTGFDPTRYGIPKEMAESTDRVTCFAIVATVDAFLSAGLRPEELLARLHPSRVANTQGSGIGGMESLRRLYLDELLDRERQSDVIQESLINVMAGYVVQSYVGSYGPMSHPVAACATAAVSLEEAYDKIRCGKADFVVAGGFDDIGEAGVRGFGDMNATADTRDMAARGIDPVAMCRPNDVRRGGFLEAQGGGTMLVTTGRVAAEMGLPVAAVVGWVGSFGDGVQTSVPAPGLGAVAAAQGGSDSPIGRALTQWRMNADDIRVVYKHDTSTRANDPNENRLHATVQRALGRTPGAPLFVVSQKSITGHPKGGAAAFQIAGACQAMATGIVPGNRNLETVDASVRPHESLVFTDTCVEVGPVDRIDAALVTSLGFGHVSAFALLLHPDAFVALLDDEQRAAWEASRAARAIAARRRIEAAMAGLEPWYERRVEGGFAGDRNEAETRMLLDPDARWDLVEGGYR